MLFILSFIITACGLALIGLGRRGRRIDDHPICRKCRFDLVGVWPDGERCPECGAGIAEARARRVGNRRRSRRMAVAGAALLIASAGWLSITGGLFLAGPKANPYKPVWLLSYEARHARYDRASPALVELLRRIDKGLITNPASIDALVEAGLTVQGDQNRPWLSRWGDLILSARAAGRVSDAQLARFYRQAISAEVRMHDRARVDDQAPISLEFSFDRFSTSQQRGQLRAWFTEVSLGTLTEHVSPPADLTWFASSSGLFMIHEVLGTPHRTGPNDWRTSWEMAVQSGPGLAPGQVLQWNDERSGKLLVVSPDEPLVEVIRDDALINRIRSAITPVLRVVEVRDQDYLQISFHRNKLTVPISFEVILQWVDTAGVHREQALRARSLEAGDGPDFKGGVIPGGQIERVSGIESAHLILRPSLEVAERDVDIQRTWLGPDLVYEVEVERIGSAAQTGGGQ